MNLTFFLDSAVNIFFSPREVFGLKGVPLLRGWGVGSLPLAIPRPLRVRAHLVDFVQVGSGRVARALSGEL